MASVPEPTAVGQPAPLRRRRDHPGWSPGTLFFSFQDLDSTKPAGSVKIRVETITQYLEKGYAAGIIQKKTELMQKKTELMPPGCPLL